MNNFNRQYFDPVKTSSVRSVKWIGEMKGHRQFVVLKAPPKKEVA